ncbi:hypothetical protein LCGC14_1429290 [marine sediment metagenome]|uniref:Uncharacterized protein n=1 Tax=marine sediment metagenome TaxID=412755 RepID=A0A0F9M4I8_9ZZZZ
MPTEEETRKWGCEEWARLDKEKEQAKQDACSHARSGTLRMKDKVVICDSCGKELDLCEDTGYRREED